MSLDATGDRVLVSSGAQAALEHVQGLLASATTTRNEQVAHIVAFLANDRTDDLFGEEEDRKRAEKEALVNQLASGHAAHLEAASQHLSAEVSRRTADASAPTLLANDLVASDIAAMQAEQEELLKKLTGQGLLAAEAHLRSQTDPSVVDQIIGALANEENGTDEGALLTSEFNGEVGASAQLLSTTNSDESARALLAATDIVATDIANTQAEQEALLDKLSGAKLAAAGDEPVALLPRDVVANDIANTQAEQEALLDKLTGDKLIANAAVDDSNEVVAEVIANLASANDVSAEAQLLAAEYSSSSPALALEASAVSAARLRASEAATTMAAEQDHLPHVMFGGAFLLVAAVLLTVMTRRSRRARASVPQDDAYAYFLHE